MIFKKTIIQDSLLISLEKKDDNRGFFSRLYCSKEFGLQNILFNIVQINNSLSEKKGTLRGMHYQKKPYEEGKIIRCIKGSLYDVIIDLRKNSNSYKKWFGVNLSSENRKMLYVPKGCAHGFLTQENDTEIIYLVDGYYEPNSELGIRYDDFNFNINWPMKINEISKKDLSWQQFKE